MQSSSRNGATVRWLCVHTAEGARTVGDLRAFFDRTGTGSSHAGADSTGALAESAQGFVPYDRAAWTLRNGNPVSDNLELCAFAVWTRSQWLAVPALLEACARWLAARSRARGISLQKLTVAQVRQQAAGVIDHDDYTDATGDGTHWDVGESFPWDVVLPRAIVLAGGSPPPVPARKRRRRTMYLTRNTTNGACYLVRENGLTHLRSIEEVNCMGWLLDDTRAANATLNHNPRFHQVIHAVLTRAPVSVPIAAGRGSQPATLPDLPAPVETEDPNAIAPPPGMEVWLQDAPGHV